MDPSQILAALNQRGRIPVEAIEAARAQRDAIVPLVLNDIDQFVSSGRSEIGADALFIAFHLLGEWREKSAYRPLARLLRSPPVMVERVIGDAISETSHRVMTAVFDGDPEPIYEVIRDPDADEFVRSRMLESIAMLTLGGALPRSQTEVFLRDCYDTLEPRHDNFVWSGWQSAIARLGFTALEPLVREAFARDLIDPSWLHLEHFLDDLAYAVAHPDAPVPPPDRDFEAFEDTVAELEHWDCFEPQRETRNAFKSLVASASGTPARNPFRDVGRNDPCPCGSGKKFKKCCLGAEPEALIERMTTR